MHIDQLIEVYIKLRDRRFDRKSAYEESDAEDKQHQAKIEAKLMEYLNAQGLDKVGCDAGTAYKATRSSATVADWDPLLAFIKEKELWELLERRVSKTAVEQYLSEHQELPPGVNISREVVVNFRRSQ